jgi:hypothetical protein
MWTNAVDFLDELWLITRLARHAGIELKPVNTSWSREEKLQAADLIIFGYYGRDPENNLDVLTRYPDKVSMYIQTENAAKTKYWHMLAGLVTLSWGQRVDLEAEYAADAPDKRYMRIPWWLPYSLDRSAPLCKLHPDLYRVTSADSWINRSGFATLLSRHYNYPRTELYNAVSEVGKVECPSEAFHNMEWPPELDNNYLTGKIDFLRRYRYNICPENGWSSADGGKGYNTEKAPQAFMAGAVPIYWGDALDPLVFNHDRMIIYKGDKNALVQAVRQLESNASFRSEWFSRPVLQPTADMEVEAMCNRMVGDLRWLAE